ncbi:hypothetical protein N9437_02925 [Acidimicrobiia bacterium]|nr:hypothetical protein [Acidimicrobiia bacterium]
MNIKTKLGNRFRRLTTQSYPNLYRPSSYPFASGDSFRKKADHIFDEVKTLEPSSVKRNDIVFLKTELKDIFFNHYHNRIKNNYILICHNSDASFDESDFEYIDSKIIHCFSQKLNMPMNDLISPLPSGLENRRFRANGKIENYQLLKNDEITKSNNILCSFNVHTNFSVRKHLKDLVQNNQTIDIKTFSDNFEYLKELSKYKYNLCPEGNNFESHRIWESLVFGTRPIVLSNNVNNNFVKLGVPLLVLESWDHLLKLDFNNSTNKALQQSNINYYQFTQFNYWWNKILDQKV